MSDSISTYVGAVSYLEIRARRERCPEESDKAPATYSTPLTAYTNIRIVMGSGGGAVRAIGSASRIVSKTE